ncbi:MAG: hypothetical protein Q7J69_04660 [Candidatus Omnitrophota bacterium]|nr:hypothetical protein [Candidatus Omnitrophota bacterium]
MNGLKKVIALSCLAGFALGIGTGWWAGRDLFPRRWGWEQRYESMLERFSAQLKLTSEQTEQVKVLLETKRQKMEGLRTEIRPRREEIRISTQSEIRKLLSPEQQEKFDRMEKEWQVRRAKRHGSR